MTITTIKNKENQLYVRDIPYEKPFTKNFSDGVYVRPHENLSVTPEDKVFILKFSADTSHILVCLWEKHQKVDPVYCDMDVKFKL
jgi:hypothetical protein